MSRNKRFDLPAKEITSGSSETLRISRIKDLGTLESLSAKKLSGMEFNLLSF